MSKSIPGISDPEESGYEMDLFNFLKLEASTAGIASAAVGRAALARRFLVCSFAFHQMQVQLLIMSESTL